MRQDRDPIQIHAGRLSFEEHQRVEAEVESKVKAAFQQALNDPSPETKAIKEFAER
jgi:TPP-dependent pyruvate/acetoin dehydrogenase alpha subunit